MTGQKSYTTQYEEAVNELHSILDMVRWSVSQFNANELYYGHGTDNAWDEAMSLILQTLSLPAKVDPALYGARLTTSEKWQLINHLKRRIDERVPVPYLTNQAWFCGLPFYVDERVLVPRSPFGELIEDGFSRWFDEAPKTVLDMCTGSACIAIAAAMRFDEAQVDAVDISEDALDVAQMNIEGHGVMDRVIAIQSDLFNQLQGHQYDLIICNPPYVDAEDMADLPAEFQHEPRLGLAAGDDGLDLVHRILREAPAYLADGGWLFVEVGNSLVHVQAQYPELKLEWVEFKRGGDGVFAIQKEALMEGLARSA